MKKVLALMIGCALSGTLVAGKAGYGSPVTSTYVDSKVTPLEKKAEILEGYALGTGPTGIGTHSKDQCTASAKDQVCVMYVTAIMAYGDGTFDPDSNLFWDISIPTGGGIHALNEACQWEGEKRINSAGVYKAIVAGGGQHANKYFKPNLIYVNQHRQLMGIMRIMFSSSPEDFGRLLGGSVGTSGAVWTGSKPDGTPSANCNDFKSKTAPEVGTVGNAGDAGGWWLDVSEEAPCEKPHAIYCVQVPT